MRVRRGRRPTPHPAQRTGGPRCSNSSHRRRRWWKSVHRSPEGGEWTVNASDEVGNSSRRTFRIEAAPENTTGRLSIEGLSFQRVNPDADLEEYRHEQTGIDMVLVPGGAFQTGYEKDLLPVGLWLFSPNWFRFDQQWGDMQRQPAHAVELSLFLIARSELTREQWARLAESEFAEPPSTPESVPSDLPESDRSPEECRRWLDQTHPRLAFPTEAQWEYACRVGTDTDDWMGDELPAKRKSGSRDGPRPIASLPANPWGLHDVHGVVAEWCEDWFAPYETDFARDPQVLTIPDSANGQRVLRGGSDDPGGFYLTPAWFRDAQAPDSSSPTIGLCPVLNLRKADELEK